MGGLHGYCVGGPGNTSQHCRIQNKSTRQAGDGSHLSFSETMSIVRSVFRLLDVVVLVWSNHGAALPTCHWEDAY